MLNISLISYHKEAHLDDTKKVEKITKEEEIEIKKYVENEILIKDKKNEVKIFLEENVITIIIEGTVIYEIKLDDNEFIKKEKDVKKFSLK